MNMNGSRAQVGVEFIAVFFMVFLIFLFLQVGIIVATNSLTDQSAAVAANNLLVEAATLMDLASSSTVLSTQVVLPPSLPGGFNYVFGVSNSSIYIAWNGTTGQQTVHRQITAFNVTNSSGATRFFLLQGTRFITKTSSGVVIR